MRAFISFLVAGLLVPGMLAAVPPHGVYTSTFDSSLAPAARQTGECSESDYDCLCMKALDENNRIRMRHGKTSMPSVGPVRMLQNALDHTKTLPAKFEHQDLIVAAKKVQCDVFISGENIAMHQDSSITDHAAECMRQWENSPGHLSNILSDYNYTVRSSFLTYQLPRRPLSLMRDFSDLRCPILI
jgi:hypothetical protein